MSRPSSYKPAHWYPCPTISRRRFRSKSSGIVLFRTLNKGIIEKISPAGIIWIVMLSFASGLFKSSIISPFGCWADPVISLISSSPPESFLKSLASLLGDNLAVRRNDLLKRPFENLFYRIAKFLSTPQRPKPDIPGRSKTVCDAKPSPNKLRHEGLVGQTKTEVGKKERAALPVKEHCLCVKRPGPKIERLDSCPPGENGLS